MLSKYLTAQLLFLENKGKMLFRGFYTKHDIHIKLKNELREGILKFRGQKHV